MHQEKVILLIGTLLMLFDSVSCKANRSSGGEAVSIIKPGNQNENASISEIAVEVRGKGFTPDYFRKLIKCHPGMRYSESLLQEDMLRIYRSGYVDDVIVKLGHADKDDNINIIFEIYLISPKAEVR